MTRPTRRNPSPSSRPARGGGVPFPVVVAGASLMAGAVTWQVAPRVEAMWTAPTAQAIPVAAVPAAEAPVPEVQPVAAPEVYYPGCRAVRAAGAAPLFRGSPGYRPEMDGDDDGIACEDYGGGR